MFFAFFTGFGSDKKLNLYLKVTLDCVDIYIYFSDPKVVPKRDPKTQSQCLDKNCNFVLVSYYCNVWPSVHAYSSTKSVVTPISTKIALFS